MANYMFLFRGGMAATSPEEMQKSMQKWVAWIESLSKQGIYKGGEPLTREGRVVSGKKKTVTDGPFAEAKDLVGGYFLVTANDYNHAVELARGCPSLEDDDGSVEIREIQKM
jgi:hypothetical protein